MVAAVRAHAQQRRPTSCRPPPRRGRRARRRRRPTPLPRCRCVRTGLPLLPTYGPGDRVGPRDGDRVVELGARPPRPAGSTCRRPCTGAAPRPRRRPAARRSRSRARARRAAMVSGSSSRTQTSVWSCHSGSRAEPGAVHPDAAVVVEEDRRVDAVGVEPHRVGPRSGRVGGRHEEVAATRRVLLVDERADQPERAVVVPQRGRVQPARRRDAVEVELAGRSTTWPICSQLTRSVLRKHRQAREVLERRRDEVEVLARPGRSTGPGSSPGAAGC